MAILLTEASIARAVVENYERHQKKLRGHWTGMAGN